MAARLRQNPAVSATVIDDEVFLVEPETEDVFYLDAVSSGLWRLLGEPRDEAELVEIFAAAFPDQARDTLALDIAAALEVLVGRELVVRIA